MKRLSATEAISPAMDHVSGLLGGPRNWRLILKIGFVACFAQLGGLNFNTSFPPGSGSHHLGVPLAMTLAIGGLIVLALSLGLFYLGSRLEFTLFDIILRRQTLIAPSWRYFGSITWRWIGLKLLFLLAILVCLMPFLVPIVFFCMHHMASGGLFDHSSTPALIAGIVAFILAAILFVFVFACAYTLLADFGLPAMALESTSIRATAHRVWQLFRAEPGQFLLYLLMRLLLLIAGSIACEIALVAAALILLLPLGGASFALWLGLHHAALTGHIFMVVGWVVAGLILAVLLILAAIALFGYVYAFIRAYSLYFLAGRYPLLGQYLDPPAATPELT